ncbi:MAG: putative oxidoreductase [Candidatus Celerinatantimonas neptuna]|nr:MAG: putative oxidoreductase [Candidatus Celerinatantimonas neptuna]
MNILITGATSGIGYQLALDYKKEGHQVWACGRNTQALANLAVHQIHTIEVELTDAQQVQLSFAKLPPLQLVILGAGICNYHDYQQFDGQAYANVIAVNLQSIGYCLEALWLKFDTPSKLALMGSLARYLPFTRSAGYGASKAGLYQLAKVLRTDLPPRQINIYYIEPGFVDTPLTRQNPFQMPWLLSCEKASKIIRRRLTGKSWHIAFPWPLYWILKTLSILPVSWQNAICRYLAKQEKR